MWRRPRWGLILCAFSVHDWALTRAEALGMTTDLGYYRRCRRCGATR